MIEFENGDSVHRAVEQQQLINQALRETMTPAHPQNQQVSPSAQVPPGPIAELLVQELDQTRKTSSHASSQSAGVKKRVVTEDYSEMLISNNLDTSKLFASLDNPIMGKIKIELLTLNLIFVVNN